MALICFAFVAFEFTIRRYSQLAVTGRVAGNQRRFWDIFVLVLEHLADIIRLFICRN